MKVTAFATAPDGVRIAYDVVGEGSPVVLIHGFASSRAQNWKAPGWYQTLSSAGYRVLALDCRGHGESDKPHDASAYGHDVMAQDVISVMDAAEIGKAHVMGYSMGGFIAFHLLMDHAKRVDRLVIGGVGASYLDASATADPVSDPNRREMIADALLVEDPATITNRTAKEFRAFADQSGKDRFALAACMRAARRNYTAEELSHATNPVLVVCGEKDHLTGSPEPLAAAFTAGAALTIPGRDHMSAVGDKTYKQAVLDFLK